MEYIVAAYAPDKLNDPSQAEPIVQRMIRWTERADGLFPAVEDLRGRRPLRGGRSGLLKARDARRTDPTVWNSVAGYYNRQGEFEKTMEAFNKAAELDPNNPRAIT
jgi:tetratricopeptide (TPR) repeat protein